MLRRRSCAEHSLRIRYQMSRFILMLRNINMLYLIALASFASLTAVGVLASGQSVALSNAHARRENEYGNECCGDERERRHLDDC